MDKRKFEEKIEKSIENAAAHFEQRVESVAAKAEKRIEAAADRFDKSVELRQEQGRARLQFFAST